MSGNWHKRGNLRGANGIGVPEGGQPGQMLQKVGSSDYATGWAFPEYKDILGKVPKSALPDIGNSTQVVDSESAMLNLPAVAGNMVIRTDLGKTFVLAEEPANVLENWVELVTGSDVQSVNGQTGNVTLTKADVGLSNVSNTADSDKPVATQSVPGLLSAADKKKLDNATSNATGSRVAMRDSAGKSKFKGVTIESAPTANTDATTKAYVDAQVSSVAGGSVLSNTDWGAMRSVASTGVVEGFVKGCPAGGKVSGASSEGFVSDPVWRLEVRPEGLDYVTQRATLLNCTPKFMVGFIWERIYNPATAEWSKWTCVGGDTGWLDSEINRSDNAEVPVRYTNTSSTYPYSNDHGNAPKVRRIGNECRTIGAHTNATDAVQTNEGLGFGAFYVVADPSSDGRGYDYIFRNPDDGIDFSTICQGSSHKRWRFFFSEGYKYNISRYSHAPGKKEWSKYDVTWSAPVINTYTGPGFVPPVLDNQFGTGPTS